jgi:hypothetical protein
VLSWTRDAQADGYSFYPDGGLSHMRSVDLLFNAMTNAKRLLPSVTIVTVPHSPPRKIITYEFAPQSLHLLQNPKLMTSDNLLIDLQNPLAQYQSPGGELGDALSGSVYRNAYTRYITKQPNTRVFCTNYSMDRSNTYNRRWSVFIEALHGYASNIQRKL